MSSFSQPDDDFCTVEDFVLGGLLYEDVVAAYNAQPIPKHQGGFGWFTSATNAPTNPNLEQATRAQQEFMQI